MHGAACACLQARNNQDALTQLVAVQQAVPKLCGMLHGSPAAVRVRIVELLGTLAATNADARTQVCSCSCTHMWAAAAGRNQRGCLVLAPCAPLPGPLGRSQAAAAAARALQAVAAGCVPELLACVACPELELATAAAGTLMMLTLAKQGKTALHQVRYARVEQPVSCGLPAPDIGTAPPSPGLTRQAVPMCAGGRACSVPGRCDSTAAAPDRQPGCG